MYIHRSSLRVLALGNYTLSHDWEIDWIASLGKQNGHSGLQEIYLDECLTMWHALCLKSMGRGTMKILYKSKRSTGATSFEVSNERYPPTNTLINHSAGLFYNENEPSYT